VPENMKQKVEEYREMLMDKISMFDDELAEKFLAGEDINIELVKKAIRQ
jgi:elongation factor G